MVLNLGLSGKTSEKKRLSFGHCPNGQNRGKQNYLKTFGLRLNPPTLWTMSERKTLFFLMSSLSVHRISLPPDFPPTHLSKEELPLHTSPILDYCCQCVMLVILAYTALPRVQAKTARSVTMLSNTTAIQVGASSRAPEKWERWERVPSQFEILAATFG